MLELAGGGFESLESAGAGVALGWVAAGAGFALDAGAEDGAAAVGDEPGGDAGLDVVAAGADVSGVIDGEVEPSSAEVALGLAA